MDQYRYAHFRTFGPNRVQTGVVNGQSVPGCIGIAKPKTFEYFESLCPVFDVRLQLGSGLLTPFATIRSFKVYIREHHKPIGIAFLDIIDLLLETFPRTPTEVHHNPLVQGFHIL